MTLKKWKGVERQKGVQEEFPCGAVVGTVKGEASYQRKTTESAEDKEVDVMVLDNMHN